MKQRSLPWIVGGAVVGAVSFGVLGFLFGKYGLVETDFVRSFPEFRDPEAVGSLTAWLVGLVGMVLGGRYGRHIASKRDRAQRRREREDARTSTEPESPVSSSTRRR